MKLKSVFMQVATSEPKKVVIIGYVPNRYVINRILVFKGQVLLEYISSEAFNWDQFKPPSHNCSRG